MRASPRARHVVGPAVGKSVGVSSMAAEYPIQATLERTLLSAACVFLTEPDHKSTPVSVEVIDFIERLAVESGSHQRHRRGVGCPVERSGGRRGRHQPVGRPETEGHDHGVGLGRCGVSVRLTEVDRRIVREVERVVMSSDGPISKDMADRIVDMVRLRQADRKRRDEEAKGVTSTPTTTPSSPWSGPTAAEYRRAAELIRASTARPPAVRGPGCRPTRRRGVVRSRVVDGKVDPASVQVFRFKNASR
jgi:hypothetical protein